MTGTTSTKAKTKPATKRVAKAATARRAGATPSVRKAAKAMKAGTKKAPVRVATTGRSKTATAAAKPKLLAGGNPQIPKGEGDAPVQAYIAAMPGWKRDVGRRLDALIARAVPGVRKAVKWNSPFYGAGEQGWFVSFHCFARYVKVAFFRGASLHPVPPGTSKHEQVRYLDLHEDQLLADGRLRDEARFVDWVKQASRLPGERM